MRDNWGEGGSKSLDCRVDGAMTSPLEKMGVGVRKGPGVKGVGEGREKVKLSSS